MPVLRLCVWLAILAVLFVPLERLFALREERVFRKGIAADLAFYFVSSLVPSVLLSAPLAILAWVAHRLVPAEVTGTIAMWPLWLRIAASFVVGEVGFYWGHRWSHEIPLLWRFHAVHHSAEHMDWLVNTRAHPVDMVFTRLCGLIPLYVLGLGAPIPGSATLVPLLIVFIGTLWGFFVHANVRWRFGPLEWLIATPAFHHWHHTNDGPAVINKNYASTLPWMDWLFGTMHLPRRDRPVAYGIDERLPPSFVGQMLHPFAWRGSRGRRFQPAAAGLSALNGPPDPLPSDPLAHRHPGLREMLSQTGRRFRP